MKEQELLMTQENCPVNTSLGEQVPEIRIEQDDDSVLPIEQVKERPQDLQVKKIAVLTSGGDAPGMNGLIRAVTRTGLYYGMDVFGVQRGYRGLEKGEMIQLHARDVSDTLQRGGTFLKTARSQSFMDVEGQKRAANMCQIFGIDAVICAGGEGTWCGAEKLARQGVKVIALPATIDNDIASSDYTVGYDTAMNTALDCIDKLRDTASSHERCSVVEVMGRHNGYLAMTIGIATGAEIVLIPERKTDFDQDVIKKILSARNRGKHHYIIIVAEGAAHAEDVAKAIEERTGIESRATDLGYVQRGGNPSVRDRYMASLMGYHGVQALIAGRSNRAIVYRGGKVVDIDLKEAVLTQKKMAEQTISAAEILSF